jgi:hypothetical protein
MADDLIRYDVLTQEALRGVVRKILAEVAQTGLPGDHHFFITFDTHHPDARISSRLAAQYPDEMTVVMQHQFWDLTVTDTAFEIGLSFNGVPERLLVPFKAICAFVDPHVSFGLKFEAAEAGEEAESADTPGDPPQGDAQEDQDEGRDGAPDSEAALIANDGAAKDKAGEAGAAEEGAEVVSLDAFRKKNG